MNVPAIVPIVTTTRFAATRAFWIDLLGCQISYDSDHYLGVRTAGPGSPELGFMLPDADAPHAFAGAGLTFALGVPDADAEHRRLVAAGAPIVAPPTDQPWGMRSFMLIDPNGIAVVVGHRIPMAVELQTHLR